MELWPHRIYRTSPPRECDRIWTTVGLTMSVSQDGAPYWGCPYQSGALSGTSGVFALGSRLLLLPMSALGWLPCWNIRPNYNGIRFRHCSHLALFLLQSSVESSVQSVWRQSLWSSPRITVAASAAKILKKGGLKGVRRAALRRMLPGEYGTSVDWRLKRWARPLMNPLQISTQEQWTMEVCNIGFCKLQSLPGPNANRFLA